LWLDTDEVAGTGLSSIIGYSEVLVDQTLGTSFNPVTVTVPAGRRIKISAKVFAWSTVANDTIALDIKEGATTLQISQVVIPITGANGNTSLYAEVIISPSAGAHTYTMLVRRGAGSGTVTVSSGATIPAFLLVEDVTGTLWPAGQSIGAGTIASEVWTDWTPTWTNLTVGSGTVIAKYSKIGRLVNFRLRFTYGAGSAIGTAPVYTLPIPAASDYIVEWPIGKVVMVDNGIKAYNGDAQINSLTQGLLRYDDGLGSWVTVTATVPFTWASGDYFFISGTYEAAS
jgi:hypothetical protein